MFKFPPPGAVRYNYQYTCARCGKVETYTIRMRGPMAKHFDSAGPRRCGGALIRERALPRERTDNVNDQRFKLSDDKSTLTDLQTGETFEHPFTLDAVAYWANGASVETKWTFIQDKPGAAPVRLKIVRGRIEGARWPKEAEERPRAAEAGQCWSGAVLAGDAWKLSPAARPPEPKNYSAGPNGGYGPDVEASGTVDFGGTTYYYNREASELGAAVLPDQRVIAFMPGGGHRPGAVVEPMARASYGHAWLMPSEKMIIAPPVVASGGRVLGLPDVQVDAPVLVEELGDLISTDPNALNPEAQKAPIVNQPLLFWTPGYLDKTGQNINNPLRGIVLARFRVPEWFGAPRDDDSDEAERFAYFVLTTAPGILATDRDEKAAPRPGGSIMWVDEKWDLRPLIHYLPRLEAGKPRASEVFLEPRGKRPFQRKTKDGLKPGFAWRIVLRWIQSFTHPEQIRKIMAMIAQAPDLPFRPGDNTVEVDTVEGSAEGDPSY